MNHPEQAWADLERALDLGRRTAELFATRWFLHQTAGRYEAALAEIDQAIALAPDAGEYHYRVSAIADGLPLVGSRCLNTVNSVYRTRPVGASSSRNR